MVDNTELSMITCARIYDYTYSTLATVDQSPDLNLKIAPHGNRRETCLYPTILESLEV